MATSPRSDVVEFDGRIGEGGGQIVRIALALSAITGIPIRIHHIRGNRKSRRSKNRLGGPVGGLKAQHVACVSSLAKATNAEVQGGHIGSPTLEFIPSSPPVALQNRQIKIDTDSAASTLLVFQSTFPFLLFAADKSDSPITVTIRGGTNVSFSSSYEYLDQVLLPTIESLGVPVVERRHGVRGWSQGGSMTQIGIIEFSFKPIPLGQSLHTLAWPTLQAQPSIKKIDITIIVPENLRISLLGALTRECSTVFPNIQNHVLFSEDSKHKARIYTLVVAHTESGWRFGRDWLYDRKVTSAPDRLAAEIAKKVVQDLSEEIQGGRGLDEFLQDQLIVFQALAKGVSSINGNSEVLASIKQRTSGSVDEAARPMTVEETSVPFGNGSMHTKTARWVVSMLLPGVKWYDEGRICEGVGWAAKT